VHTDSPSIYYTSHAKCLVPNSTSVHSPYLRSLLASPHNSTAHSPSLPLCPVSCCLSQPQGTFWNVGSMPGTGRLIAPEQRWMSQEAYRPMKGRPDSLPGSPRATAGAAGIAAPGGRPSGLCPPWATHTEPAAATNTASLGGSFHSRSIRSYDSFNSSGMASVLGGGVEGQEGVAAQQRRPMTAAAAEAAPRRYPWEWPGA